jgi:hypothetical protein
MLPTMSTESTAPSPPLPTRSPAAPDHAPRSSWSAGWRRHRWFLLVVTLGCLLRALVQLTYWPAMWNPDSHNYFHAAESLWIDTTRPSGYGFFLHYVPGWTSLWPVAVLQHVLAVAVAVGIYLVLQRWGVPRWGAALATVPLLLDPMQVSVEQFMLSDLLSELLIMAACLVLLWGRRTALHQAALAGLLLGAASTVRSIAEPVIILAVLWVVVAARRRVLAPLLLLLGAAVPLGSYVVAYHNAHGAYATSSFASHYLYLRVGVFADCEHLRLPDYEKPLCLADVPEHLRTDSLLLWQATSPPRVLKPPPGMTVDSVLSDFNKRVIKQQPVDYVRATTRDVVRAFYPTRHVWLDNHFDGQWLLRDKIWFDYRTVESKRLLAGGVSPRVDPTGARIAEAYPFYVPGPVSVVWLLVAGACVFGYRGARRQPRTRLAVAFVTLVSLATVIVPAATTLFCWRYQIIQIALLPVATALALTAMAQRSPDDPAGAGPDPREGQPEAQPRDPAPL